MIVSTSTSSGKTLVYQIPVIQALESDINSTALFLFPTKALAQDQKRGLTELMANCIGLEDIKVSLLHPFPLLAAHFDSFKIDADCNVRR